MAAGLLAVSLAACVSAPSDAPAWFAERDAQDAGTYPSLRDVPRTTVANTDAAHWQTVEQEVVAAGQEMRANPRAEPASAGQDPAVFVDEARRDLETARDAHPQ
jgi:hypothetical protein